MLKTPSRLLGSVALAALLAAPGLAVAQTDVDWESNLGEASDLQVSEATGSPVLTGAGEELGQIEYFALLDEQFVVVISDPQDRQVALDMSQVRYEDDEFLTDLTAEDVAQMEPIDPSQAERVVDDATIALALDEVERRGALAAGEAGVSTEAIRTAGGRFIVEQAEPQVTVDVPDPQVTVDQRAPEVVVEQPEPTITVTQSKPDVTVEQQAPVVTVEQAQPTVTVDIPEPVVTIRMPEPDVDVATPEPSVNVQQPEPVVRFVRPEPRVVIEEAEAQIDVTEAEAQVEVTTAEQAQVAVDQGEPQIDMQTAGEADVVVEQAEATVNVEPAEGANVDVDQAEAEVNVVDPEQAAAGEARDGFIIVALTDVDPVALEGVDVYDPRDERIGEVSEVISSDGEFQEAIVNVGGFLGLGRKEVALDRSQLTLQRSEADDMMRLYVDISEQELQNMPAAE